jgi:hypothetical protein
VHKVEVSGVVTVDAIVNLFELFCEKMLGTPAWLFSQSPVLSRAPDAVRADICALLVETLNALPCDCARVAMPGVLKSVLGVRMSCTPSSDCAKRWMASLAAAAFSAALDARIAA